VTLPLLPSVANVMLAGVCDDGSTEKLVRLRPCPGKEVSDESGEETNAATE
jgi:hypothetical protein